MMRLYGLETLGIVHFRWANVQCKMENAKWQMSRRYASPILHFALYILHFAFPTAQKKPRLSPGLVRNNAMRPVSRRPLRRAASG